MLPCMPPRLAPETGATDNDLAAERLEVASWGMCTEIRRSDLVKWIREN